MKIIRLKAENIKKLVAVEITPTGSVIKITGPNASGKTSILDAIFWALGGLNNIQAQPIRKGQTKAKVEIDLGEMLVKRTFNEGGTTSLTIENKDGLRFKSPQTMLDGLLGKLSFDPLEFMREKPGRQFLILSELTGLNFSKLDGLRQRIYDERAATNRDVKRLEVQIEGMSVPSDAPKEEVGGAEIVGKIRDANELRNKQISLDRRVETLESEAHKTEENIEKINAEIRQFEQKIKLLKTDFETEEARMNVFADSIWATKEDAGVILVPDISALNTELAQVESKNKAARAYQARVSARNLLQQLKDVAKNLTDKIQAVDKEKRGQIAKAKFPLDGLSFGDGAVIYNDLPMDQASHAEQLRVSMAMAMSLNPKLKVIRITDGSLLDSQSMKVIENMAKDQDYQVWIEQMDESGKVGIVISEGEVVAVNE